jgi:pimeloyl-ACP methyl ester carboxylesterase
MDGAQGRTAVVLLHGLYRNGWDMTLLRMRLSSAGIMGHPFTYPSVRMSPRENAERLMQFIASIEATTLHFVAHSLGGLVIRHLFHLYPEQRPGRVVTLGTPHRGSRVAVELASTAPGQMILGESIEGGLFGDAPDWSATHDLGVIAGDSSIGMGHYVAPLNHPNDGTVAVEETYLAGAKDHIVLPVSHFSMLISSEAAHQTEYFLRHGRFERG